LRWTFGILYQLSKQFEGWEEWGRPDHDLTVKRLIAFDRAARWWWLALAGVDG